MKSLASSLALAVGLTACSINVSQTEPVVATPTVEGVAR